MPLIILSDGHGIDTLGKRSPKFENGTFMKENEFNQTIVNYLEQYLKYNGFNTLQAAPTDKDTPLIDRVITANNSNGDLYISIHANAHGDGDTWTDANGIETFIYKLGTETAKIGKIVQGNLIKDTGLKDRGLKEGNFYVLKYTKMPAVLVECGFMTNKEEVKLLMSDDYRRKCAKSIAKSICQYYGKEFKDKDNKNNINNKNNNIINKYNPQVIKERIYSQNGSLKYCTGDYSKKATDVRWIKFDMNKIRLEFVYEKGKKVSDLVKKYKADYGFNFPFFYNGYILGDVVSDNKDVLSSSYNKMHTWSEIGYKNGKVHIGQLNKNDNWDFLIQGNPLLINNGNMVYKQSIKDEFVANDIANSRSQRTFIGIDKNNNLIVCVSDGRLSTDIGLSLEEEALFLKDKGCIFGINGDGGGSSVICENGDVLNANRNNERITHHAVLIYLKEEKQGSDNMSLINKKVQDETEIFLNEKELNNKVIIIDGVSYAPVREIAEKLGLTVVWDGQVHLTSNKQK